MIDSDEGQVIYQMNNFGRYLAFPVYMTSEERKKQLEKLESEAETLLNAINKNYPDNCNIVCFLYVNSRNIINQNVNV